ncbi:aminotransferase class V-fold PLP-dependent enzyme [Streptomyces triculaminicus]|uniref:aminotransferase class V-fold PLP-dependent enzyme n=1 Tax=Streptomyces triculaminicus TaxID=2816232 RepID=UPI0037D45199
MRAPFRSGVQAGRPARLRDAEPYLAGGGANRRVISGIVGVTVEWQQGCARHEAGSPNVVGVCALAAVTRARKAPLVAREEALLHRTLAKPATIPRVKMLSLLGDNSPRVSATSFVADGWTSSHLTVAFSAEHGIGVRNSMFYPDPRTRPRSTPSA